MTTEQAMQAIGAASAKELADKLHVTEQAVSNWRGVLPPLRVYQVEALVAAARA